MPDDPMVSWLRGALDEIERVAREAADEETGEWHASGNERVISDSGVPLVSAPYGYLSDALGGHIALHDPRAVLARVEAERAIVSEYEVWDQMAGRGEVATGAGLLRGVVRVLAWGHRHDVPGWLPEWAPEGVAVDA